jgi:N-methylhydantoinase B
MGDGASAVQVHMTNTRNTPVESLESAYPLRMEFFRLRRGSGGKGRNKGGEGLERGLRLLVPARITLVTERRRSGAPGSMGGASGSPGQNLLTRAGDEPVGTDRPAASASSKDEALPSKLSFDAKAGDLLTIITPGGGGWGVDE